MFVCLGYPAAIQPPGMRTRARVSWQSLTDWERFPTGDDAGDDRDTDHHAGIQWSREISRLVPGDRVDPAGRTRGEGGSARRSPACGAAAGRGEDREGEAGERGEDRQAVRRQVHRQAGERRAEQRAHAPDQPHHRVNADQLGARSGCPPPPSSGYRRRRTRRPRRTAPGTRSRDRSGRAARRARRRPTRGRGRWRDGGGPSGRRASRSAAAGESPEHQARDQTRSALLGPTWAIA